MRKLGLSTDEIVLSSNTKASRKATKRKLGDGPINAFFERQMTKMEVDDINVRLLRCAFNII